MELVIEIAWGIGAFVVLCFLYAAAEQWVNSLRERKEDSH